MIDPGDDVAAVNRALWTVVNEQFTDAQAHDAWAVRDVVSGALFADNSESQVDALGNVVDLDVLGLRLRHRVRICAARQARCATCRR